MPYHYAPVYDKAVCKSMYALLTLHIQQNSPEVIYSVTHTLGQKKDFTLREMSPQRALTENTLQQLVFVFRQKRTSRKLTSSVVTEDSTSAGFILAASLLPAAAAVGVDDCLGITRGKPLSLSVNVSHVFNCGGGTFAGNERRPRDVTDDVIEGEVRDVVVGGVRE